MFKAFVTVMLTSTQMIPTRGVTILSTSTQRKVKGHTVQRSYVLISCMTETEW